MTTISILPKANNSYRAVAGDKESTGRTAGEALDAITRQLGDEQGGTLVIVQNHKPDQFFNAAQQERLTELMQLREAGNLSSEEESELESLVEAELDGARQRVEQELRSAKEALTESDLVDDVVRFVSRDATDAEMELFRMFYLEDLSAAEIAGILHEDLKVIRVKLARIRAKLHYRLKRAVLAEDSEN